MAFRVVEGTFEMQGTVSGTDATTVVLTDPTQFPEHTSPNILRIWVENPSTCPDVINNIFNGPFTVLNTTASGSNVQIVGAGEVSVTTAGDIITVSGTPHSAGGSPAENALIGVDGITVISGVNTTTISGFLGEFVSASGSLQTQINNIDSSVTLQEAYDNGDGTILTTGGSKPVLISGTVIASGTDGKFIASDGSFTFPSYTFEGDTSTGFYLAAAGAFGITAGGSNSLFLTTSEVQAIDPLRVPVGSQASPGIRFAGDANTGFYSPGADVIGLTVGNSTELTVSGTDTGNSGVGIQTKLTTVSGIFTESLTVSGSPVCIDCPDFSQFATITELVTTSGHLQTQIDSINVDEIEPAIVGDNGIVVTSGVDTTTVQASGTMALTSGTYTESLTVSGTPVELAGAVDLQVAYDNSADGHIAIPPGIGQKPISISGSFSGFDHGLVLGGQDIIDFSFSDIPSVLSIYGEASFGHFTIRGLAPGAQPQFFGTTARGSFDAPQMSQGGDVAFSMGGIAHDGDNYASISAIQSAVAAPVVSGSDIIEGRLVFSTTDSTGNQNSVMSIHSTESVSINETNPGIVDPYALYVVGSGIFTDDLVVNDDFSADTGAFTTSLTVSGSPVCINCPDFSTFATLTDLTTTSGHLQNQIDSINVDEIEPAIVGVDGITVISGSNTTVSGFRTEFVSASGSLQSQIDGIDPNVTLQDAYDDGNTITTVSGSPITIDGAADSSNGLIDLDVTGMQGGIRNSVFSSTVPLISSASTIGQTLTLLEMDETVQNEVRIDIAGNLFSTFSLTDGSAGNILDIAIAEVAATTFITPTLPILLLQSGATDGANVSSIRLAPATGGEIFLNPNAVDIDTHINAAGVQPAFYVDGASGNVGIRTDMPWCELTVVSGMCVSGTGSAYTFIDENLVTVVSGIQISAHGAHPVVSSPALNTGTTVLYSATNEVSSNTIRVEMGASDIASFILTQNTAGDANISMSVSDFFGATSIVGDGAFTIANNNNATMALASTADLTLRGATGSAVWVNPLAEDVDFRVSGDNDLDLIYANAAVDRVGIGTEVPGEKLSVEGTISGSTLKTGDGNVEGLIEDQSGMIDLPVGKNYTLVQSAKYDFTIDEITHQTVAGTCSGTLTINGTAIEGMDNLIMNSSETTSTATASFTVTAGDRVQLAISGTSDAEDLAFTWQRTRL